MIKILNLLETIFQYGPKPRAKWPDMTRVELKNWSMDVQSSRANSFHSEYISMHNLILLMVCTFQWLLSMQPGFVYNTNTPQQGWSLGSRVVKFLAADPLFIASPSPLAACHGCEGEETTLVGIFVPPLQRKRTQNKFHYWYDGCLKSDCLPHRCEGKKTPWLASLYIGRGKYMFWPKKDFIFPDSLPLLSPWLR